MIFLYPPGVTIDHDEVVLVNIQDTLVPRKSDDGGLTLTSITEEARQKARKIQRSGRPRGSKNKSKLKRESSGEDHTPGKEERVPGKRGRKRKHIKAESQSYVS